MGNAYRILAKCDSDCLLKPILEPNFSNCNRRYLSFDALMQGKPWPLQPSALPCRAGKNGFLLLSVCSILTAVCVCT